MQDTATEQNRLINVTERARAELEQLIETQSGPVDGIRLGVKGGGCSGLSYVLDFSQERVGDHVVEQDGLRFFLDRKSAIYLKGILLDYQEGLKGKGFVFRNPNASNTCGCGESFSM